MLLRHSSSFLRDLSERLERRISQLTYPHRLLSIYIVGGNAESLANDRPLVSPDLDLLFLVDRKLAPGERPIRADFFDGSISGLTCEGRRLQVIFNGIAPVGYDFVDALLDVQGMSIFALGESGDAIITAVKPRVLLWGEDRFRPLQDAALSREDAAIAHQRMVNYVRREFFGRDDPWAVRAIAKNAIFLASLLSLDALRLNDQAAAVECLSRQMPELSAELAYFFGIKREAPVALQPQVEARFEQFTDRLREMNAARSR